MSESAEVGTKTVRIDAEIAKMIQTISALKDQMGARFKSVEFLNGLLRPAVQELYDSTVSDFTTFKNKGKGKPSPGSKR